MGNNFALFDNCTLWCKLKSGNTSAFNKKPPDKPYPERPPKAAQIIGQAGRVR